MMRTRLGTLADTSDRHPPPTDILWPQQQPAAKQVMVARLQPLNRDLSLRCKSSRTWHIAIVLFFGYDGT